MHLVIVRNNVKGLVADSLSYSESVTFLARVITAHWKDSQLFLVQAVLSAARNLFLLTVIFMWLEVCETGVDEARQLLPVEFGVHATSDYLK